MGYIGRSVDKISNIETLDNITFDGSSSYSLTKNSVAFSPSASQNILISIDGVVQSGNFTVSGSTIDFGVAISSSSVCNFIIHLGVGIVTTPSDGSVTNSSIASNAGIATSKLGAGAVLQVVSTTKTDEFASSLSSGSSIAVTGLSVDITPTSTSNKILVMCSVNGHNGSEGGGTFTIKRDSTEILIPSSGTGVEASITGLGVTSDSSPLTLTIHGIDLPSSTSQLTYSVTMTNTSALTRICSVNATDGTEQMRGCSTITAMEIAG